MQIFWRYTIVVIVLFLGYFAMSYMQIRFDRADLKRAITTVKDFPLDGIALPQHVSQACGLPLEKIEWKAEIKSKFWGNISVFAICPQQAKEFEWVVDLSHQSLSPANEITKGLSRE